MRDTDIDAIAAYLSLYVSVNAARSCLASRFFGFFLQTHSCPGKDKSDLFV